MSIEKYLRIVRETSQTKQVIKESKTPVVKKEIVVENPYRSSEQVLGIVQRMMEDARVPQKPRQGPLRQQTGAGRHQDKKKAQKQGKEKHKKPFSEGGYNDQFSLGGRLEKDNNLRNRERNVGVEHERNNYQVVINGKLWKVFADQRQAMNIARSLKMKGKEVAVYPTGAPPSESIAEATKKPNATTRHLRDYPVSDKDVAKPVKKTEKKKPEQGVAEEKQKGVDGKACWKGYKRMGTKKKGGKTVDNCVKMESISEGILSSFGLMEKSPPGFKGTVKAMKKHPELTKGKTKDGKEKNPWALAWHMKNKGYKSHKKADGSDKD